MVTVRRNNSDFVPSNQTLQICTNPTTNAQHSNLLSWVYLGSVECPKPQTSWLEVNFWVQMPLTKFIIAFKVKQKSTTVSTISYNVFTPIWPSTTQSLNTPLTLYLWCAYAQLWGTLSAFCAHSSGHTSSTPGHERSTPQGER